jgi:hypothetical protein
MTIIKKINIYLKMHKDQNSSSSWNWLIMWLTQNYYSYNYSKVIVNFTNLGVKLNKFWNLCKHFLGGRMGKIV